MGAIDGYLQLKSANEKIILTCNWNRITEIIKVQIALNLEAGVKVSDLSKQILKLPSDADFDNYCQNYGFTPKVRSEAKISIYQFKKETDASATECVKNFPNDRPGIGDYTLVGIEHLIVVELLNSTGGVVSTVQGIAD